MGSVSRIFHWDFIDAHATVGIFMHGYADDEFVDHCIVPKLHSNEPSGAVQVKAQLTSAETSSHVDGTIAHTLWVENQSVGPQPFIEATLIRFRQTVD